MSKILTNIEIEQTDLSHKVGQFLIRPLSITFGHSFRIEKQLAEEFTISIIKKVIVSIAAIVLFPVTLVCASVGAALLHVSSTHKHAYEIVEKNRFLVIWKNGLPEIHTTRLILRPIQKQDLETYEKLFNNQTLLENYGEGPRDIIKKFSIWLKRWEKHSFSALAVIEKSSNKVIGHVIAGHGDYESDTKNGSSKVKIVIEPAYWNCRYGNVHKGIGTAGNTNIGSEVFRGIVGYAKTLKKLYATVPCDVDLHQNREIEEIVKKNPMMKIHRNAEGKIDWVSLPFTQISATAKKGTPSHRMFSRIMIDENGGTKRNKNLKKDLFLLNL